MTLSNIDFGAEGAVGWEGWQNEMSAFLEVYFWEFTQEKSDVEGL